MYLSPDDGTTTQQAVTGVGNIVSMVWLSVDHGCVACIIPYLPSSPDHHNQQHQRNEEEKKRKEQQQRLQTVETLSQTQKHVGVV